MKFCFLPVAEENGEQSDINYTQRRLSGVFSPMLDEWIKHGKMLLFLTLRGAARHLQWGRGYAIRRAP